MVLLSVLIAIYWRQWFRGWGSLLSFLPDRFARVNEDMEIAQSRLNDESDIDLFVMMMGNERLAIFF